MADSQDVPEPARRLGSLVDRIEPVELRTDIPHSARMYDYYLGGKDNFPADRETAEQVLRLHPDLPVAVRQGRLFMGRAVRFLVAAGVRQFLDVGTGIPTSPNLHETAQQAAPDARVVYIDNDPIVLAHARALLSSTPQGATAYLDADVLDGGRILDRPEVTEILDLSRPVALFLFAIMHFVPDERDPYAIVAGLLDRLPTGSYLALSHGTADFVPALRDAQNTYNARGVTTALRTRAQIERFFDGLELVEPGVTTVHTWRPDGPADQVTDAQVAGYGGVGRKR